MNLWQCLKKYFNDETVSTVIYFVICIILAVEMFMLCYFTDLEENSGIWSYSVYVFRYLVGCFSLFYAFILRLTYLEKPDNPYFYCLLKFTFLLVIAKIIYVVLFALNMMNNFVYIVMICPLLVWSMCYFIYLLCVCLFTKAPKKERYCFKDLCSDIKTYYQTKKIKKSNSDHNTNDTDPMA